MAPNIQHQSLQFIHDTRTITRVLYFLFLLVQRTGGVEPLYYFTFLSVFYSDCVFMSLGGDAVNESMLLGPYGYTQLTNGNMFFGVYTHKFKHGM